MNKFIIILTMLMATNVNANNETNHINNNNHNDSHENHTINKDVKYVCPMHPNVVSDKEGRCHICGMFLVEKKVENMDKNSHNHSHHKANKENYKSGEPFDGNNVDDTLIRIINISASDLMKFSKEKIVVSEGEKIKFVVSNDGKINHEFTIGTIDEINSHHKEMMNMPNMIHNSPNSITISPNSKKELFWSFKKVENIRIACLINGHYQAGMFLDVIVK